MTDYIVCGITIAIIFMTHMGMLKKPEKTKFIVIGNLAAIIILDIVTGPIFEEIGLNAFYLGPMITFLFLDILVVTITFGYGQIQYRKVKRDKIFSEKQQEVLNNPENKFELMRIVNDEQNLLTILSDKACFYFSDRRVYLSGDYIGTNHSESQKVINLETIKNVYLHKRRNKKSNYFIITSLLLIAAASFSIYTAKVKTEYASEVDNQGYETYYHEGGAPDSGEWYDYYNRNGGFLSKSEIEARKEDMENNQNRMNAFKRSLQAANNQKTTWLVISIILVIVTILMIIIAITYTCQTIFRVMYITVESQRYGIELKDSRMYHKALDIINRAKASVIVKENVKQAESTVNNSQCIVPQNDKISHLSELANLYEKGLIQQEDFEQLKNEILQK